MQHHRTSPQPLSSASRGHSAARGTVTGNTWRSVSGAALGCALAAVVLAGCDRGPGVPTPRTGSTLLPGAMAAEPRASGTAWPASGPASAAVPLRDRRPSDPRLAALYESACLACHTQPATGAPQVGDSRAWAPRLERGRDALLENVRKGLGTMPPMGGCASCSVQDLSALVDFLAGTPAARPASGPIS